MVTCQNLAFVRPEPSCTKRTARAKCPPNLFPEDVFDVTAAVSLTFGTSAVFPLGGTSLLFSRAAPLGERLRRLCSPFSRHHAPTMWKFCRYCKAKKRRESHTLVTVVDEPMFAVVWTLIKFSQ